MSLIGILILYIIVYLGLWLLASMLPILGNIIKGLLILVSFVFMLFWLTAVLKAILIWIGT
jgi:hypothetical protein